MFFLFADSIRKFWDYGWLLAFISYQILFIFFPIKAMLDTDLSIGCSVIITTEQVCILKKSTFIAVLNYDIRNKKCEFFLQKNKSISRTFDSTNW